jgi:hypothetical protein
MKHQLLRAPAAGMAQARRDASQRRRMADRAVRPTGIAGKMPAPPQDACATGTAGRMARPTLVGLPELNPNG